MTPCVRRFVLGIAGYSLFAQQPPENIIKLNVRQVLVPVVVTDKKGHFITDLHASDFHITEDAVPQDIVSFSRETALSILNPGAGRTPSRSSSGVQPSAATPQGRMWILCFDSLHTSSADFARVRAAVDKLLTKGHQNGDRFVLLSLGDRIRVFQTATTDLSLLRRKLDSQEFTGTLSDSLSSQLVSNVNELKRRMDTYCTGCPCGRDAINRKDTCDVERQQIKLDLDARSEKFAVFGKAYLNAFKAVIEEFAKING